MRFFLVFFLGLFITSACCAAGDPGPCGADDAEKVKAAIADAPATRSFPAFPTAPAGGAFDVAVRVPDQSGARPVASYRAIMDTEGAPRLIDDARIEAQTIPSDHWLVATGVVGKGDTLLRLTLPTLKGIGWHNAVFTIIACPKDGGSPVYVSRFPISVSDGPTFFIFCALLTIVLYCACAYWCKQKEDPLKLDKSYKISLLRYLDPVVLSSGPNGKGSISRLQVLFFSTIVFFILLYSFLRVGLLSDLSITVLELLGISAIGAAASKATDLKQNRLDWENWVWLIERKWLPENGLAAITKAKWGDLVTSDDGFDVYHFQMLIFSVVVAIALLLIGFNGLATFKVPDSILAMLGLTQVVYVGGKLVAPQSCKDLNDGIEALRKAEGAYFKKLGDAAPATEDAAAKAASPEFGTMRDQFEKVKIMFASVMGDLHLGEQKLRLTEKSPEAPAKADIEKIADPVE